MDHRKATRVLLCWEAVVFRLQNCEENTRNKITAPLHRKNIKHMLFSQKIGIVGSSKCIKYPCVFPLRTRGSGGRSRAVVQGEAVQPNPCSSCWGGPAVPGPPLAPAKTTTSSDAIQEITQRRKEQTGTCGLSHMRGCWRLYSKYVGYSGKW